MKLLDLSMRNKYLQIMKLVFIESVSYIDQPFSHKIK